MGDVYRGVHTVIGKPVAIKVLKWELSQDEEMVQRLIREARAVNAIKHPGIVDIFGCGTLPKTNQPFIVMDLLVGESLEAFLDRSAPLQFKVLFAILEELLLALTAAHEVGVIHRDLKPGNVFLERQVDGRYAAKLLDFGLARQAPTSGASIDPTRPGLLMGTPAFMAPEQILGKKIGPQTDLYALGGIAYQMATGHLPLEADSAIEILSLKLRADPSPPSNWNSQLPTGLEQWIMGLLERDPEKRPRSADEVRQALALIRDSRSSQRIPAVESENAPEPKTLLFEPSEPPVPMERAGPNSMNGSPTRLLWSEGEQESSLAEEGSGSVPIPLLIILGVSLVAIGTALWWLFNS